MAELRIGTSGWVYKHWRGDFYPAKLPADEQLSFYAERFDSVEINYSYYRLPERSAFEAWRKRSPEGFRFAVKASRFLTHLKKLKDPSEPLARLMDHAAGLEEKLGPILLQFPGNWPIHIERLEPFLELLTRYRRHRFAFEFRHPSWLVQPVYDLLERAGAALCLPVHPAMPLDTRITAHWTYVRFHAGEHGLGFTHEELRPWANRIGGWLSDGADSYVYFNNDIGGHAFRDAGRLRDMLAGKTKTRAA